MLKKRLVGVITVKSGWAVQSFGYCRHLPLGHAEYLAENLDRWGVDEILVLCIDRHQRGLGPDLDLLRRLAALGLSTPLAYGGGIRNVADAASIIKTGAERVCIDAAMQNEVVVREISALLGAQAIIGALPLSVDRGALHRLDYLSGRSTPLTAVDLSLFEARAVSEALIIDWCHEGRAAAFDMDLIRLFPVAGVPLIAFGGVSEANQLELLFDHQRVAAVGVGNFLAYREHAVQKLKHQVDGSIIRAAQFASGYG